MLSLLAQGCVDQSEGVSCITNSKKLGAFDIWSQFLESCRRIYEKNTHASCPHLRKVLEGISMVKQTKPSYAKELSVSPSAMFVIPSRQIFGMNHI